MTPRSLLVLPALALLVVGCGMGPREASGTVASGPADGDAIEISATDNAFSPAELELEPGTEVTVEVANDGDTAHNLVIDELDLSTGTIDPGEVVTATFTVPDTAVDFVCTFHPGMSGQLEPAG